MRYIPAMKIALLVAAIVMVAIVGTLLGRL
jgi:hypothetical protein